MEKVRNDIIQKIICGIPANMKPAEYIVTLLGISKGSAYRRLNGELSFSFEEVAVLAKEMNFSVDEIIYSESRRKYIIEFGHYFNDNVENIIYNSLLEYYNHLCINQKMKRFITIEASNNLWFVYTLFCDNLFSFYYYKYLQQYDISCLKMKMKDVNIPDFIIDIKNKITNVILNTHNCISIAMIDPHIFLNVMAEIQYYRRRNFLEEDDMKLITNDIKSLLDSLQKGAVENSYEGREYNCFIGQRSIYSNSAAIQNDNQTYSFFYQQNLHPIICHDKRLCELHSNYLQSHKRQSVLISNSNEELQISFFDKQYEYLRKLSKNIDLKV
ncbi:helix-turn-helix domain-containing protein [Prevotella sp. 10(H)]|uniref:helix-turn-helix domain-containing protein n=1 Tax=Prevotella sp. 10(H) TaxID=1158294 RepID=UPI0004A6C1CD|nr:helix-turn-helix domain-containing protein [Prevotella sp. 10(H)]